MTNRRGYILGLLGLVLVLALACGPAATPTHKPAGTTPTTAVRTPTTAAASPMVAVPTATATAVPTIAPPTGGKVTASASDFLPVPDASQKAASQILRVRYNAEAAALELDPAQTRTPSAHYALVHTTSRLVRAKFGTTDLVPDAAESWEISADFKTVTFKLRQGIQWQGGLGEFTAQDVVNHYQRMAGNDKDLPNTLWKGNFTQVESMTAPDKYTFQIKFKAPDASFFRIVFLYRTGQLTKVEAVKTPSVDYFNKIPGIGPFKLASWEKGVKMTFDRNPDYFLKAQGLPYLDRIEQFTISDDTVAELAIKQGQVDILLDAPTKDEVLSRLISSPGDLKITEIKGNSQSIVDLNKKKAPLDNLKVRQAMYYSVDWDGLIQYVLNGRGQKTFGPLPTATLYYDDSCVKKYDYNVTLAKQLLTEAGFPDGKGLRNLEFVVTNSGINSTYSEYLNSYWKKVGIPVDIKLIDTALSTERRNKGDYDLYYVNVGIQVLDPAQLALRYYSTANFPPGNNNSYHDKSDDALTRLVTNFDPAERKKALCEVLKNVSEDANVLFGNTKNGYVIASAKVQNVQAFDENTGGPAFALEAWIKK